MQKFGEYITKNKIAVLVVSLILLVLSFIGMIKTKVNYDILVYLPDDIETIKGQNVLTEDFKMGGYSIALVSNTNSVDVLDLQEQIKSIDHVSEVMSIYDLIGVTIPVDFLPSEISSRFHKENTDVLLITFDTSTSDEETLDAVKEIRELSPNIKQGGMSSEVLDTMLLSNKEIVIYIVIAVILCLLVLELSLDSYIVPLLLLGNIGASILFNLGSNIFLGQISYITKSLVAVLQLGVTTDFSIFLYHSYQEKKEKMAKDKAMALAIKETFTSVAGSSLTTIAGFLVLIAMQLTLGKDLGIVMAKGVLLGVISVVTLFPSLLLVFDKLIEKTKHKKIIPKFNKLNNLVIKHHILIFIVFLLSVVPAYLSYKNVSVYYKLDDSLPKTLESIESNTKLQKDFNIVSLEMILIDKNLKTDDVENLSEELSKVDGVDFILSTNILKEYGIELDKLSSEDYQLIILNSLYDVATDELNNQTDEINNIVKSYDEKGIVAGVGPLTKDLIKISDKDFNNVNTWSIICIFIILFFVLKSLSLPILLISVIETAIFINMGISYFGGSVLPFIAPIVLGTIQLGATIDYAILISTTYLNNRKDLNKEEAMKRTLNFCAPSIFVSGMCFFAATFGVGAYSEIEMIGAICTLISRGALISMALVILVLPSVLLIFDRIITRTTIKEGNIMYKNIKKLAAVVLLATLFNPVTMSASEKKETVYAKLNYDGSVKNITVNEQLKNTLKSESLEDYTELKDILNLSNNSTFTTEDNKITWNAKGKDIIYEGKTNKELPVLVNVKYYLNDEEKTVDEMLGKEGKVKIVLNYTNTDKHFVRVNGKTELMYTPFAVAMGTIISNKENSNIEVVNGKVVSNGNKSIVIGLAAPGMYENLYIKELKDIDTITITYDTTKFELATIYNVVTPKILENSDLKAFDKLNDLYSSVDDLKTNMDLIEGGSKELVSGSNKLKVGVRSSIANLNNKKNTPFTDEELNNLKANVVNNVVSSFNDQDVLSQLDASQFNLIVKSITGYNTMEEYATSVMVNTMTPIVGEANVNYAFACLGGNTGACAMFSAEKQAEIAGVYTSVNNHFSTLTTLMTSIQGLIQNVAVLSAKSSAQVTASKVTETLAPQVASGVLTEVASSMATLYEGIETLDSGINDLSNGISKYNSEGITKLYNTVNTNVKETANKLKVLNDMSENYNTFAGSSDETRFILAIESKKVAKEVNEVKKEEVKLTFWQRIKNLFK